jgi:hypothetical protein
MERKTVPVPTNTGEIKAFSSHHNPLAPDLLHDTCQTDPDLARIVDAWPSLPESVRDSIMLLIKAAGK